MQVVMIFPDGTSRIFVNGIAENSVMAQDGRIQVLDQIIEVRN